MKLLHWVLPVVSGFLLAAVAFLAIDLHRAGREQVITQFNREELLLARLQAHELKSYLDEELQFLRALPSVRQRDSGRLEADLNAYFDQHKRLKIWAVGVYDVQGALVCGVGPNDLPVSASECDFFSWSQQVENRGKAFLSSCLRTKPVAQGSPIPPLLLCVPVLNRVTNQLNSATSSRWAGVLVLTIDLEEVLRDSLSHWGPASKPPRTWLMDQTGTLLVQPEHPEMVGRNVHQVDQQCLLCHGSLDYVKTILSQREGTTHYQMKDGPLRLAAFAPVRFANVSFITVVNFDYGEVTAFARNSSLKTLLLLGLMGSGVGLGSVSFYQAYRSRVRAEREAKQWQEKFRLEETIRQANDEISRLHEQNTLILNTAKEGILGLDKEGRHIFVNPAAAQMLGFEPAEMLGQPSQCLWPNTEPGTCQAHIQDVYRDRLIPQAGDGLFCRKDDTTFSAEYTSTPISENGQLSGAVIIFRDITERKLAEAERDRLIEELKSALAEVKTLSGIVPICSACKKIRDDQGYWKQVEIYVQEHSLASFSHGMCPDCAREYMDEFARTLGASLPPAPGSSNPNS